MAKARDRRRTLDGFAEINHDAAGIDVGNAQHWVAVPAGRDPESVRMFGCFTADLHALANWLERCGIKTVAMEDDERVKSAMLAQRALYPIEYATPVHPENNGQSSSIVASHSLIPDALFHAFSTFGALMSPELPLQRRQHEMIATMVSVTNRCVY